MAQTPETVTAKDFLVGIYPNIAENEVICWYATYLPPANPKPVFPATVLHPRARLDEDRVTHACVALLRDDFETTEAGNPSRKLDNLSGWHVLVLDDVGTKAKTPSLRPSWIMETSPGNFQWGYIFREVIEDRVQFETITQSLAHAGLMDENCDDYDRLFRTPNSLPVDKQHRAKLISWNPERRFTSDPDELLALFEVAEKIHNQRNASAADDAMPAPPGEIVRDEVETWLGRNGYITEDVRGDGWMEIICPWAHLHGAKTDDMRQHAKYFPATTQDVRRRFKCHHTHGKNEGPWGEAHRTPQFLKWVAEQGGPEAGVQVEFVRNISDLYELAVEKGVFDPADRLESPLPIAVLPDGLFGQVTNAVIAKVAQEFGRNGVGPWLLFDIRLTQRGGYAAEQPASPANIERIMALCGARKRLNLMTQTIEFEFDHTLRDLLEGLDTAQQLGAIQQIAVQCNIKPKAAQDGLEALVAERYHPMEDWLETLPTWDGVDRLAQIADGFPVRAAEPIGAETPEQAQAAYATYVRAITRRWFIQGVQAVAGWRNEAEQVPFVLVFCGEQGQGKTTWILECAPPQFTQDAVTLNLSGSVTQNRDSIRQATRVPINELGELETTFRKSDQGALKNYLSATEDTYRLAYARTEITVRRCSVYAGSVNTNAILRDETGSRRFWPISLDEDANNLIPRIADHEQVWAQALALWDAGEPFHLSQTEKQLHDRFSEQHREVSEVEDKMNDAFPNGFYRHDGRGHDLPEGLGVVSVSDIVTQISVKGDDKQREQIRLFIKNNGGRIADRVTDPMTGNRRKNATYYFVPKDHLTLVKRVKTNGL